MTDDRHLWAETVAALATLAGEQQSTISDLTESYGALVGMLDLILDGQADVSGMREFVRGRREWLAELKLRRGSIEDAIKTIDRAAAELLERNARD